MMSLLSFALVVTTRRGGVSSGPFATLNVGRLTADDGANVAWVRSAWSDIAKYGTGEVYLNFTGRADEAPDAGVDSALGRNMARLAEIKAKYDPDNFFRVNDNIAPAG